MEEKYFQLSASGLKNIFSDSMNCVPYIYSKSNHQHCQKEKYKKTNSIIKNDEFKFIFGSREIRMNRFFADFISPRISKLHQTDPTINSIDFTLIIRTSSNECDFFDENFIILLHRILNGEKIELDMKMIQPLRVLSIILGNDEIYQKMNEISPIIPDQMTIESCIEILQSEYYLNSDKLSLSFQNRQIIDFIASHFYSIDTSKLFNLPHSIIYSIISNEKLKLENEDSLLEFIEELFSFQEEELFNKTIFYEEIEFSSLSDRKFNEFIEKFNQNEMTEKIWQKLIQCFYCKKNSLNLNNERYKESKSNKVTKYSFNYNKNSRFKGIIFNLLKKNENFQVTASSVFNDSYLPKNVIDFNNKESSFYSLNLANSFLQFDFKDKKIKPSHYSIRSNSWGEKNWFHLQSWVIECSNNEIDWIIIDSRQNEKSLNDRSAANTFEILKKLDENDFYRFIRIRQTDTNASGSYDLIISAIEFFGSIMNK